MLFLLKALKKGEPVWFQYEGKILLGRIRSHCKEAGWVGGWLLWAGEVLQCNDLCSHPAQPASPCHSPPPKTDTPQIGRERKVTLRQSCFSFLLPLQSHSSHICLITLVTFKRMLQLTLLKKAGEKLACHYTRVWRIYSNIQIYWSQIYIRTFIRINFSFPNILEHLCI